MQKSILDKTGQTANLAHTRKHSITGTDDHTSTATEDQLLKANANGLPVDATNSDTEVSDAVTKAHSNALDHDQNTDTALGAQTEDLDMNAHQVVSLSVPDAAGEAIRQTAKITEAALEDAVDKKHTRSHSIVGTDDHSDVADFIDGPLSPGVLTGGLISEGTEGTVTVSAITALLRTGTETTDPLVKVTLAEQANKVIGSADTKYHVGLDYNGGAPQILVQTGNFNRTTEIGLGTCMKDTSSPVKVHFANAGQRNQDGVNKLQRRATSLRRTELASGCRIADVGGATRQFSIQKGVVYHGIYRMTPFDDAPYNPYISGDDGYFLVYGDSTAGFTISDGTDTVINNTQYWNTTTHALATVTVNQYACHWVYIHTDDEHVYVMLGNDSYKLAEAQLSQPPSDTPLEISDFGLLLGCIIIERNATAFELVQMVTDTFFTGSAVGVHNSLGGLNDGDDYEHITQTHPIDADKALYRDSTDSDALVTSTWTQVKAFLKTYFDTLYNKYVLENHASNHTDGTDDIQSATNAQKGVATAAHITAIEANTNLQHTQGTDTTLGTQASDINMGTHKLTALSVPSANGQSVRTTTKITEANLEDAVDKKHAIGGDTTLGTMTADVNMNTHKLTSLSVPSSNGDSIRATTKITEVNLESAVDLKHSNATDHTQGTDTTLGTMTQDINMNGLYQVVGLQAPAASGEALRQTTKSTESRIDRATDGITPYIIATGETVTIDTDEQLNVTEEYLIEGTGSLEVNGNGSLNISDGPNTGERDTVFTAADNTKLDGIETEATADQTGAEVKSLYEAEADTNAYTDTEKTKLSGIETGATVYPSTGEQAFLDADHSKLDTIEDSATADQTGAEIKALYEAENDTNAYDDDAVSKLAGIEASADKTDSTNVNTAGAVMESDFDATTFMYATSDNTPEKKTVSETQDILKVGLRSENLIPNSGFWSCSELTSLSNYGSAIADDDAANDDTSDWTKNNCTLTFDTDHYVIDPSANAATISYANSAAGKLGHLYRISIDVKDGTSAGVSIYPWRYCGSVFIYGRWFTTTASWVTHTFLYYQDYGTTVNQGLYLGVDPGGNVQIKNFTVYEVNPTFSTTYSCDEHSKTSGTVERITEDSTHCRGFYGLKLTRGAFTMAHDFNKGVEAYPHWYSKFAGQTVTFGMYVYSVTAADNAKIRITDSAGYTESSLVGADTLTWVEITRDIASTVTSFDVSVYCTGTENDVCYISRPTLVIGDTIGDGNWSHPKNEIIRFAAPISSSRINAISSLSSQSIAINPQGDSGGAIGYGTEAILTDIRCNDSGSATNEVYSMMGADSTYPSFIVRCSGLAADKQNRDTGWIYTERLRESTYTTIVASGSGTFDMQEYKYLGIMVK